MKLQKIKAVLFDMDGTIINSETVWRSIKEEILQAHNISTEDPACGEFLDSLAGTSTIEIWRKVKEAYSLRPSIEELMDHSFQRAMDVFHERVAFIEGFEKFHKKLSKLGIPTAIATNAPLNHLQEISKRMQFERFFGNNLFSVSHVNDIAKPDPTLFLHVVKQLRQNPEDCVVFEDSLPGFEAAKRAGIKCIGIKHERNKDHRDLADAVIDTYHEAYEILKKL